MGKKCIVCGAKPAENIFLSFHLFPSDENRCVAWKKSLGFTWVNPYDVVCSKHFNESDYETLSLSKKKLKLSAIPLKKLEEKSDVKEFVAKTFEQPGTSKVQEKDESMIIVSSDSAGARKGKIVCLKMDHENKTLEQPGTSSSIQEMDKSMIIDVASPKKDNVRYIGELEERHFSSPRKRKKNINFMKNTVEGYRKKIKFLQKKTKRLEQKITNFTELIDELKALNMLSEEASNHLLDSAPESIKEVLNRQIKSKTSKYTPELRSFALTLHFYSPKGYNFVREKFKGMLPHPSSIKKWYSVVNGEPGFTSEAFDSIKEKVSKGEVVIVNLIVDEMSIRQHISFDGKKYVGLVDLGRNFSSDADSVPEATHALVFMLNSVNSHWKVPVAYFFIKSLTGEERSNLLKTCLEMIHSTGAECRSITFDGAYTNTAMIKHLGANIDINKLEPWIQHPVTLEKVFVFLDPCHMLKLCRNTLGDRKEIRNSTNNPIKWDFLVNLQHIQETEGLYISKITKRHINFQNEKMNVRLAAQTLSESTSKALEYLLLNNPKFKECAATSEFCLNINNIFDILNSRNRFSKKKMNRPFSIYTIDFFKEHITRYIDYLKNLKEINGALLVKSNRKIGFLGFIICLKNILNLYEEYIVTKKMSYILSYKINQDPLETFFSAIRSRGGFNNNPSTMQFQSAYKRLLVRHEISTAGNCISNIPILSKSKREISDKIVNDLEVEDVDVEDHDYCVSNSNISQYVENVLEYMAGYVVKKILDIIECFICKMELLAETDNYVLINIKSKGGLVSPNVDVVKILYKLEQTLREKKNLTLQKKMYMNTLS
ncbi:unnamed protein product [Brassicogethes aeneus]|uniref:THAP-type domain-containing protein n=1 Tax=Brassicogethes aeneus TaxID=1431903 RepID=A0A9P0B5T7_BRAAE|nr:unnamed protein product [Brassicogethes aeneus]